VSPADRKRPARSAARRRQVARRRRVALAVILILVVVAAVMLARTCGGGEAGGDDDAAARGGIVPYEPVAYPPRDGEGIKIATFLGDATRRFYGRGPAPKALDVVWRTEIGSGWSSGKAEDDPPSVWAGTGWTGQPALVRQGDRLLLLVGGYDHALHKLDARDGHRIWRREYDDILKSSPSVFENPAATGGDDRYIVCAGSRRGYPMELDDPDIAPYRAFTLGTGDELWRLPVPQTAAYTRDCDGSGVYLDGRLYIGVESGWLYALDPLATEPFGDQLDDRHADDLALEASPALLGDRLYIASGAGHLYGLTLDTLEIVYDRRIGSDMNGTAVPTLSGKLLVPVEKQYIDGRGGMMLIDPARPADADPDWYFPTANRRLGDWRGGVIGSAAVNDAANGDGRHPALAAFSAIDGNLYVVAQDVLADEEVEGPNGEKGLATPRLVFSADIGGSISTPIIVGDSIVAAGYDEAVHLYRITYRKAREGAEGALPSRSGDWWQVGVRETARQAIGASIESTPIMWDGRVYVGARDGYFYCLGGR
jgi:outer membrane protein assembly factor BamB